MFAVALAAVIATMPVATTHYTEHTAHSPLVATFAGETAEQLLEKGRTAQARGDLDEAYREFSRAARIQRGDGLLAVDATYGAAHVLTMQHKYREAADLLEQLAADANLLGDAETEAKVLLDVVALKVGHNRRAAARGDAERLKQLVTDVRVTSDTRRLIKARLS